MLLIPAIDIKDGKCVRLKQGRMDDVTVFSDDPVAVARKWADAGARRLHIVDLDGAAAGRPVNTDVVAAITEACPDLPVQVGGGIRSEDAIQAYLDANVAWVILGTRAVTSPHFVEDVCVEFPGHIIVGLDGRDGKAAVDGWSKLSHHDIVDLAQGYEAAGVEAIIYTDIARDGMMNGVGLEGTIELASQITIPVIASGGVGSMEDVEAMLKVKEEGLIGAIVGRALYEGTLDLAEAQKRVDAAA